MKTSIIQSKPTPMAINLKNEVGDERNENNDKDDETAEGPQQLQWLTIGLVDESSFRSSTLSVSAPPLIVISSLLILGILSIPFVKALMLGKSEIISSQDMRNFGLLGLAFVGIVTILVTMLGDYWRIGNHYSARLDQVATDFSHTLEDELNKRHESLIKLARDRIDNYKSCMNKIKIEKHIDPPNKLCDLLDLEKEPFISQMAFMDQFGNQEEKFQTSTAKRTPSINVKSRDYFSIPSKKVLKPAIALNPADQFNTINDCGYTLQSIRSLNTGARFSMMGVAVRCIETKTETNHHVVSARVEIPTLEKPFLPAGFRYAIVSADGLVLYHSISSKNLEENILEEVPQWKTLKARLDLGSVVGSQIKITYYGQQYRVHHQKLKYLNSHLLIFQDLSLVDAITLQTAITSYLGFIGYVLFIAFILVGGILTYGTETASWYWPNKDKTKQYFLAAGLLFVFTFWCFFALKLAKGNAAFLLLVSQSVLVASLLVRLFETNTGLAYDLVKRIAGVLACISALMLLATNGYLIYCMITGNDRDVIASIGYRVAYGLCFGLTIALCLVIFYRYEKLNPDEWLDWMLKNRFSKLFHPIYRTRLAYYTLVLLVTMNLSVVPAVNIYWNARDSSL
ncbi:MAG TPA: hypothetical protein EYQ14_09340 [Gammaproteobacteria bacterium]|nr:hypothetical protein [Gammaproteobacteria bacterium]